MNLAFFIIPEVALAGWFLLNRWSASNVKKNYRDENAMLQNLRNYWREGYRSVSRASLLKLTKEANDTAFQCQQQEFFLPHRDGTWTRGETAISEDDSKLLAEIAAYSLPIDSREENLVLPSDLRAPTLSLMKQMGINVMVPVNDSVAPQWIWGASLATQHTQFAFDILKTWQIAMQSVVERETLLLASAHLEGLEKDAASATEVLRVLLPSTPHGESGGLEWSGSLGREREESPLLFAAYPHGYGKVLIVFSEIVAPGLAAVILGSALRGYCDSLVKASEGSEVEPEKILKRLNQYVWRSESPSNLSCVVVLFDTLSKCIHYASAGAPLWLEFLEDETTTTTPPSGAGLGAEEKLDYKCEQLEWKDDAIYLLGGQHGLQYLGTPALEQKVWTSQHADFRELGQHVLGITEALAEAAGNTDPSPGVVVLRQRP